MDTIAIEQKIYNWSVNTPDKIALIDKKKAFSYKELFQNIWACKLLLEKEYSIHKGDVVLLGADKNVSFIFTYFAFHFIGAKVVPVDVLSSKDRLDLIIEKTKPKLLIGIQSNCDTTVFKGFDIFENLELVDIPKNITFPMLDDIADILFTTGTSGEAKGVLLTHGNISASAENINLFIQNNNNDVELLALPISHSFGLGRIRCSLIAGSTLVLLGNIVNMKRLFRMLKDHSVTGFSMVPASWAYIRKMSGDRLADYTSQLNYIEFGSAYMSAADKDELRKLFPNTRICMHYGLTEASRSSFIEFHSDKDYLDTIGKPSPNVQISIVDEGGNIIGKGKEGEICIRGNHVCKGYLNSINQDAFINGFFRTGDIGFITSKGYICLNGRINEIINVGGKKLSPIEVEDKIKEFDSQLDVACIGIPDKDGVLGHVVKAFVVKGESKNTFDNIKVFLKKELEKYKLPVDYEWIDEIPKTSSGKIQRQKLN